MLMAGLMPGSSFAQMSNASLTGVISDSSGGVIPGVDVTAMHVATATKYHATTDGVGRYTFLNLQTGNYTITATYQGFKTAVRSGVILTVNQAANLNLTMEPGAVTQTVNVSAQAALLNATTSTINTELTERDFEDLPANGRNYTQLLALTAGATNIDVSQAAGDSLAPGASNNPTIQGARNRDNWYMIDGSPNSSLGFNGMATIPPLDSIQEVKMESLSTDTQFGGSSGGYVNLTTKSGGDKFHGSLYEYVQNTKFNSRNPYNPTTNVTPFVQNQFGFSVGGPIIIPKLFNPGTKKLWFFGSYEGFRNHQSTVTLTRVPTAAELQGNFSGTWSPGGLAINPIYDPATTIPDPANPGKYLRTQFTGNIIPSTRFNSAATLFLSTFMPAANYTDPTTTRSDNFEETLPVLHDTDSVVGRVDYNLTDRDHLSAHYLYFTGISGSPSISVYPMSSKGYNPNTNYSLNWDHNQTPTLFFNLQYTYMHTDNPSIATTDLNYVTASNMANLAAFPIPAGAPPYTPTFGFTSYASPFPTGNSLTDGINSQVSVNVQKIWSKHTVKAGVSGMHMRDDIGSLSQTLSFVVSQTQNLEAPTNTGDAMASFLLGLPSTGSRLLGTGYIILDGMAYGAYAQDTFRVSKKLTLDFGLRYDFRSDLTDNNTEGSFNMLTEGWYLDGPINIPNAFATGPNVRKGIWNPNYTMFAPHLAVAYQVRPKTVVRAGYGLFYDVFSAWTQDIQGPRVSWPTAIYQSTPNLNTTTPTVTLTNLFTGLPNSITTPDPEPSAGYQINPNAPVGYVDEWNLSAEHAFSDNTVVTINYVGNRGVHLDCCGLVNMARTPQVGVAESKILNTSLVPWPNMLVFRTDMGDGWSTYNALELSAQRRMSHGLTFLANYTWSHSLDDACSGSLGVEGCFIRNPYQPQWDYSNSAYDLPNVLHIAFNYQLPLGRGQFLDLKNGALNNALGGWQMSGVITRQSGTPFGVTQSTTTDLANTGGSESQAMNRTCDGNSSARTTLAWFNTACFAMPAQYNFGNAGRNILRGPSGPGNYNLSFMKNFRIKEGVNFQYRAEFFNTFNLAYPSNPDASSGDKTFGEILSGSGGRTIQMSMRLTF
jgi:hypothetical protein